MEGAGLSGTQCFIRRARREWTLAEICPLGMAWSASNMSYIFSFRQCHLLKTFFKNK